MESKIVRKVFCRFPDVRVWKTVKFPKEKKKSPDVFFYSRRKKWKNGPHSYVTHLHQPPASVQKAARLIMSHCVSARRERAMLAQLPARQLLSLSLQWRVKNMLTWRPAYFPSVRKAEEGEKKKHLVRRFRGQWSNNEQWGRGVGLQQKADSGQR